MNRRTLKIIALITMTIDHIGMILFPYIGIFRIIGRISFPVFSYFVAEGCRYSSSRLKYISLMAATEAVCLVGYYIGLGEIYFSIMMTFIISVIIITAYDILIKTAKKGRVCAVFAWICMTGFLLVVNALCEKWDIMYGFWGCVMPLFAYAVKDSFGGVLLFGLGIYLQARTSAAIQMYAMLAVPLLLLYDKKKVKTSKSEKYFYYIYYPAHIAVLYFVGQIL